MKIYYLIVLDVRCQRSVSLGVGRAMVPLETVEEKSVSHLSQLSVAVGTKGLVVT